MPAPALTCATCQREGRAAPVLSADRDDRRPVLLLDWSGKPAQV
jgi:hypothetical protein